MLRSLVLSLAVAALVLTGCRGMESDQPPIHPNLDMDYQERFNAQDANDFFADGAAMRTPVPGTIARGLLRDDTELYAGRTEDGSFVEVNPVEVSREFLERGQERYDIYCEVCHGLSGDGNGVIMEGGYGYTPAPTFHSDVLREETDGYLYDVVTNGVRSMPGYGTQIAVKDRWAIVAYMRALQRSQAASEDDLPESARIQLEEGRANVTID